MDKKELENLYKDFTLQLVLSKNLDDIGLIAITKNQLKQIIKIIKHYNQIQTQVKKQKEVIDKAVNDIQEIIDAVNKNTIIAMNQFNFKLEIIQDELGGSNDILKEVSE